MIKPTVCARDHAPWMFSFHVKSRATMPSLSGFSWKQSHPFLSPLFSWQLEEHSTFLFTPLLFIPSNQVLQKQSPQAVFTMLTSRCLDWENLNLRIHFAEQTDVIVTMFLPQREMFSLNKRMRLAGYPQDWDHCLAHGWRGSCR